MEVTGQLEHAVAAGEATGDAQREQRGLGPAGGEAHALGARHELDDALGPVCRELALGAQMLPQPRLPPHGFDDGRVRVAGDHRAVPADVVEQAVPVQIPLVGALGARDARRERILPAGVVGEAAREQPERSFVGGLRARVGACVLGADRDSGAHAANATARPARM